MVIEEGVGGRDVDDVIVDLIDVEPVGARGVGVIEVAGDIDRTLTEQVEEDVAIIGRGHVRADRAEGQGRTGVRADAVVAVDVIVSADRIQQAQLPADGVGTRDRADRPEAVDAGDVGPVARAGEVDDGGGIERKGRAGGRCVGTEHELGRVRDGGDGRASRDARAGDEHARSEARGAGDGDVGRSVGGGTSGEGDGRGEGDAAGEFEGGGHAADIQDTGGELVGGGSADHAHVDIQRTGPAGVVGAEYQGAGGLLGQRGGRTAGTFKRGGERDGLARRDFDLTGVGGVTEDDRTSEGKVFGETQGGSSTGSRRQDDLVGSVAELAFGREREHTALDGYVTREVVGRVDEHEGAVARLRETGARNLAGEREALSQIMKGSTGNGEDGVGGHREGLVGQQPVGVVVGEGETEAEVRDDPRGDGLVDGLVQRQGAASAAHGDVRDDAGVELDQTGEGDGLRHGRAVAVREQGQRGRITERGGVEVTGVAGRVEDELTETLDLERGDGTDVRDLTEHRDDEIRAVDTDRGDATGLADGDRTVEREGTARGAGVIEGRQADEREVVADRTIVVVDEERRSGSKADGTGAERTGGDAEATLLRRAIVGEHDAPRRDGETTGEGILSAELEETVTGLGDRDTEADDVGADGERRGEFGVDVGLTRQTDATDVEDVDAGREGQVAFVDGGNDTSVVGGRRDRGQGRQAQEAVYADADEGKVGGLELTAVVIEREAVERVGRQRREREATRTVDGDGVGRVDRTLRKHVEVREGAGVAAVHGHATGGEHDGSVGGGGEGHHALIEDGATSESIFGRQGQDAVARLDEAHRVTSAVVGDDGVDDEIADADRPGLAGLVGDGGAGDGDLREAVDGDDERAHRDARAGDGHTRADTHGGEHRDGGGTRGRGAGKEGTEINTPIAAVRGGRVRAHGELRVGIHGQDRRTGDEGRRAADGHARAEAPGADARHDGRASHRGRGAVAIGDAPRLVEDDEFAQAGDFAPASGEHAAVGQVTDDAVERVIAAQEAAILEIEDVGRSREGDAVRGTARELEDRGGSAAGRQRGGGVLHGHELGVLVATEIAVVSAETALPHHAHAVDRIVGGVVVPVRDGPGSENAIGLGSEAGVEGDAGGVAWLADIGSGEVDSGAGRAGERREAEEGGDEVAAAVVGGERIAALGDGQRAEAFADVFASEARIDQATATHADGGGVADAVVVHPLGIPVGVDREQRVIQDQFGSIEERTVVLKGVVTAEEGGDAAVAERTRHGERIAADAAEIDAHTGSRAVEAGIGKMQIGDEVAGTGGAGDQAAAVHLAAVLEVTDELGEAVEVERAAEGVHEVLLTRAVDGVAQAEFDRTTRDIRVAAPILSVAQEQFADAHLGERRASDDLAGEVDRGAGGHLEEAGVSHGGGS